MIQPGKTNVMDLSVPENLFLWQQELAKLEASELLWRCLKTSGITQRELARRLGKTQGTVSQILSGDRNLQLSTLADCLTAMGYTLKLDMEQLEEPLTPAAFPTHKPQRRGQKV